MSQTTNEELKNKIEAILFSYGDWISIQEIKETLKIESETQTKKILNELKEKFKDGYTFTIQNEDTKWKMALKEQYEDIVSDLISGTEIPHNVLKVLSIIAYEQPVTKTRLSEILGKSVKSEVAYLYKRKFLSYEKKGIGKYYRVTKKFHDYFKIDENKDFRQEANKKINMFIKEPEEIQNEETKQQ